MRLAAGAIASLIVMTPAIADETWGGFYAGANIGGMRGSVSVTDSGNGVPPGPYDYIIHAPTIGGTLGYNAQFGALVFGAEGDLDYLAPKGQGYIASSNPLYHQDLTLGDGFLGDLTGRIGFAFDHTLLYGKGGIAFYSGTALQKTTKPGYSSTASDSFQGWTLGAGIEQKISDNLSLKLEYQHVDLGSASGYQTATVDDLPTLAGAEFPNEHDVEFDTVKIGLNLHF
jgi:outer membrane immunogenic protein